MHKLGFVNFWLYDVEEFAVEDGRILLRGANAAGKSIATQSFIPFILDGNKRPERLDPFGSGDRKMDFYLLGDGERQESIGYLYLEFKKEQLEEYRTIGIGMRAIRGKGIVDFWGFCLCDGRRIGASGVQLYERFSKQFLPLNKQKLKNLLNDNDNWAASPTEYKQLVNDRIFQYQDIRQYEQLIQLLIKVRAPKLSKESFRPSEIKKILKESLQILTDEDLSAMISAMERMDELVGTLRDYRESMSNAAIIRNEYTRYNQYILGQKAKNYLEAKSKVQKMQNRLQTEQNNLDKMKGELSKQQQLLAQADTAIAMAKAQLVAMGGKDLSEKTTQLKYATEQRQQSVKQLEEQEARLKSLKSSIDRREVELRESERALQEKKDVFQIETRNLKEQNEVLLIDKDHKTFFAALDTEELDIDGHKKVKSSINQLKTMINKILNLLKDAEKAQKDYDSACQDFDDAVTVVNRAKSELRDAELQEQEERDRLIEDIARRHEANKELIFTDSDLLSLRQSVIKHHSPADWSTVRSLVENCYQVHHRKLLELQISAKGNLDSISKEINDTRRRLDDILRSPEPIPPRKDMVQATRSYLTNKGIPHTALYEAVDFSPHLPQNKRDLLEAQLFDSGLLDALIVPEKYYAQIEEILTEYPDRFLIPGVPVSDWLTGLFADKSNAMFDIAEQCLKGISRSDLNAETALLPDGRFRCGMIRGHSIAEKPAGFVGATARQANRARQIQLLEDDLQSLELERTAKQEELDAVVGRKDLLELERKLMPTIDDLDQALDMLAHAQKLLNSAETEKAKKENLVSTAKQHLARIQNDIRTLDAGLPYSRTAESYEEVLQAIEESINILSAIFDAWNAKLYAAKSVEDTIDAIDEQRDDADAKQRDIQRGKCSLELVEAQISEIQAFLDRPENRAHTERLKALDDEISNQTNNRQNAHDACLKLEVGIENSENDLESHRQDFIDALSDERHLKSYFAEDLDCALTIMREDDTLEQYAEQASSKIQALDRERTPEKLGESLRNNYQQHNNSLLKYLTKIETVFDSPARPGMLRQRLLITLQKDGKEVSLYKFIELIQSDIDITQSVLEDKDRELFENILTETISHKLRARIDDSQKWSRDMSALMKTLNTSMGLTFSLDWKPKSACGEDEMDTANLVALLNKDRVLLNREDSRRMSSHFRSKVKAARQNAEIQNRFANYADLIREVLDFRNWYEFHIYYQRDGEVKKELTDRIFNTFSGGEKAMAIYLPQFAAISAQYQKCKCSSSCPMLLALDEAFAGVDDKNIGAMFELVHHLGFDYIMNSQSLWGCYSCVPTLTIADLYRPANAQIVTILRYLWNGKERILTE